MKCRPGAHNATDEGKGGAEHRPSVHPVALDEADESGIEERMPAFARSPWKFVAAGLLAALAVAPTFAADVAPAHAELPPLPTPLDAYPDPTGKPLWDVIVERVQQDPLNLVATLLFFAAIVHTFCAGTFRRWAHRTEHHHSERMKAQRAHAEAAGRPFKDEVSFRAVVLEFLGEVEAIFGLWVIPLAIAIVAMRGLPAAEHYLNFTVAYTEPMFVVIIMTMAATRPVMKLAEQLMSLFARIGGRTPAAWWFSILLIGPILGSFVTEPAAMTIAALLLAQKFFELNPSPRLKYATLGLLFVNISVGGTLTHFAAPPVLMVQKAWGWDIGFMFSHYGWKAIAGILLANVLYYAVFRRELSGLAQHRARPVKIEGHGGRTPWVNQDWPIPVWVTAVHVLFMAWTVYMAHYPVLFVGGFLFFLAFVTATWHHQDDVKLKPALLVGFFLAGLVVHGNLQQWWIAPVLSRLEVLPLMLGATVLTAFNDNAAITYLASLVPGFTPEMRYAVVAGAVTGGGLTVIANAPNPAGQSILRRFFDGGVSPLYLAMGALVPTVILGVAFMLLPF